MKVLYDIAEEVPKIFFQDLILFGMIILPLLILAMIIGLYVSFRIKKSNPSYRLFKLWLRGMIVIPIIFLVGMYFCYRKMKIEVEQYSRWLISGNYIITEGTIEKGINSSNPSIESFIINGQSFNTDKNPWLLGRRDIYESGRTLSVTSHEGIILLINQADEGPLRNNESYGID